MKLQFAFLIFIIFLQTGNTQEFIYKNFSIDEGLPSSEVYDMYQDKLGYIWFATDKGLSRYNGYEFENFTTKDGLPGNTVLDFYPQKNGRVYCYEYHSKSLFYFNSNFDGFHNYNYNHLLREQLASNQVLKSIHFDESGTLYTGGYGVHGLIKITSNGTLTKLYDKIEGNDQEGYDIKLGIIPQQKTAFAVYANYSSTNEVIFVNTENSLSSRLDIVKLKNDKIAFIDQKLGVLSEDKTIKYYKEHLNPTGIKRINDSLFFVGFYNNGAEIRDASGKIYQTFLPNKSVSDLLIDKEGGYWFSTLDNGIYHIKNPKIKILIDSHVTSLTKDDKNQLFVGLSNGNIGKISNNDLEIFYKGKNNNISLVQFDKKDGQLYGYSDAILFNYTTNETVASSYSNKLPEKIGHPLLKSSNNNFSFVGKDSILHYKLTNDIHDVCYYNNKFLIGTSSGLLVKENSVLKPKPFLDSIKVRIDDIDKGELTNTIFMATQDAGVIVYRENDTIYSINREKGLTNNIINEVHIENDSTLWACSNTGLNRILFNKEKTNFRITTITTSDGLLSNDIDDIEVLNDTVWVATKKGLCFFEKQYMNEKNTTKILSLSLKEIKVNKQKRNNFKERVNLKHNQNNIEFTLQAISLKNSEQINYLYRLKEIDSSWYSTKNRTISFPSLSPGSYTFQSKVITNGKISDKELSYSFEIQPPFWQSWWFYSLAVIVFAGFIYLFFRIRVLTYNKDIARELMRLAIKKLKPNDQYYHFRANGVDSKIPTNQILYVNSQGNYLDIITTKKTYTIRCKIGDFIDTTPDKLEFLRVHRSYIIRIDQVSSKGKNWVIINEAQVPVGETYLHQLEKIKF
ncbi:ligand-binding sensor domain-containing protein [Tenacibaculum sp. MEBiC06402]|uniref:ligand-binding sensor domain-containing protein n=1 Tax=unclassified Tenacibaculum TaxID=2635139 RepID=UPI003B999A0B